MIKRNAFVTGMIIMLSLSACGSGDGGDSGNSFMPIQTPGFQKSFSGRTGQVLGPFTLPTGLYKITVNTKGYFQLFQAGNRSSIFNLSAGEGIFGETVFKSHGGEYIFQTDNISAPWTLEFVNVDFSNPQPISNVNSIVASVPKVLGPYRMEINSYKITMLTDGYFQLFPINPTNGNEMSSIFNEISGNWGLSKIYTPPFEIMLFRTDNISANWNLQFVRN